jgi:hypothetical protein
LATVAKYVWGGMSLSWEAMTDGPTSPSPPPSPPPALLLTEEEVLTYLREEIQASSQAEISRKYQISPSQLNDIIHGRGALSKGALAKLRWVMVRRYRKLEE